MKELINIFIFGGLAGFAAIIGILLILFFRRWVEKNSIFLISFAVGILMASAFIIIIPESLQLYNNALLFVLIGFLIFYLIEHFLLLTTCDKKDCEHITGKVAPLGLGFHSLIDGLAIGIGFEISFKLGIIAFLGVLMHKFTEGITTISILLHSNIKRKKAIWYALLVAIATPIGALLAYFIFSEVDKSFLGIALAVAAGSFIYVSASELIPEIHRKYNKINALMVLIGIVLLLIVNYLLG